MTPRGRKLLGQILINQTALKKKQLQEALEVQSKDGGPIGEILHNAHLVTENELYRALAFQYRMDYIESVPLPEMNDIYPGISLTYCASHSILPLKTGDNNLQLILSDIHNQQPQDDLRALFPAAGMKTVLTSPTEMVRVLDALLPQGMKASGILGDMGDEDLELLASESVETKDLMDMANEAPIIRLVNTLIKEAVEEGASDIHIEPYESEVRVRFRLDGILYPRESPPKRFQNAIISRVKIMANLNIAENRLPQDGRIQVRLSGNAIDIRVSSFPTSFGERVVLRILNKSHQSFELGSLGMDKKIVHGVRDLVNMNSGVVLLTGPTGSGKSTTLYSILNEINNDIINILTVEDPVEYQLDGVGQMQVKPKIGLTFAAGLRSILRQDPDVVMIGEIRDRETAEIAIQSALTGHRVFSTLHTNDAATGVTRLLDMDVEPYLVTSSVKAFIAQRLVREICPACKKKMTPDKSVLKLMGITPSSKKNYSFYHGTGCEKCRNTGYVGRTGIYEVLPITQTIKKLILSNAEAGEIKKAAVKEGMITLKEDGFLKVQQGITTIEEVLRVI
jgi:general secretion pathway protein E